MLRPYFCLHRFRVPCAHLVTTDLLNNLCSANGEERVGTRRFLRPLYDGLVVRRSAAATDYKSVVHFGCGTAALGPSLRCGESRFNETQRNEGRREDITRCAASIGLKAQPALGADDE